MIGKVAYNRDMEKFVSKLPHRSRKIILGVVGGVVLGAGIVMIPYPGPGWAAVFIGLAILAQEFPWAQAILDKAKGKYDQWQAWLGHQPGWVKAIFWLLTAAVVVVTIWLLNGYGLLNAWFHLGWDWLNSPFVR